MSFHQKVNELRNGNTTHLRFIRRNVTRKYKEQADNPGCPFCNKEELSEIIDQKGDILLVKNKYQTLDNAYQTVLIETADCNADLTTYSVEHFRDVLRFGIKHWIRMEESGEYESVAFFKNHGALSGGSIRHAHMQITGFKDIDCNRNISADVFEGIEVHKQGNSMVNVSTFSNASAIEYNITSSSDNVDFLAVNIRRVVQYVLNNQNCKSFNLFFFKREESIVCRVVPRYVTSPYLIGYSIPQSVDSIDMVADELKKIYCFDE